MIHIHRRTTYRPHPGLSNGECEPVLAADSGSYIDYIHLHAAPMGTQAPPPPAHRALIFPENPRLVDLRRLIISSETPKILAYFPAR
jgi:hypothetical protein